MSIPREVEQDFSSVTRSRGAEYEAQGKASISRVTRKSIRARVRGRSTYEVKLELPLELGGYSCTCPYFIDQGEPCKHIWATLLTADHEGLLQPLSGGLDSDNSERGLPRLQPPMHWRPAASGKERRDPLPQWRRRLNSIRERVLDIQSWTPDHRLGEARPFPNDRRIIYLIDLERSRQLKDGFVVEPFLQRRLPGEQWDKPRSFNLELGTWLTAPDETDRLVASFVATTVAGVNSFGGAVRRFVVTEEMYDLLLRLMCRSGRCGLLSTPKPQGLEPLRWDDVPPLEFYLDIRPAHDPEHLTVEGLFRRGQSITPLGEPLLIIGRRYAVFSDRVTQVDHGGAGTLMEAMRGDSRIEVPRASLDRLLKELSSLPNVPPLRVADELMLTVRADPPQPVLSVRGVRPDSWARTRSTPAADRALVARLSFKYGDREIRANAGEAIMLDPDARQLIRRDIAAERTAMRQLFEFEVQPSWRNDGYDILLPWQTFHEAVIALIRDGWEVRTEGAVLRQPGAMHIDIRSGIDWFELNGGVDYGGKQVPLPTLLAAVQRGERVLQLGDGAIGVLPEEWLKRYATLAGLGEVQGETLKFSRTQVGFLDALLSTVPEAKYDESFERARQQLSAFSGIDPASAPDSFCGELRAYQREGLGWLHFLEQFGFGGCLADDMGLGKTVQVLALLEERRLAKTGPSLVVVPKSLVFNWKAEAQRFTPQMRVLDHSGINRLRAADHFAGFDLIVTTYGTLRRDAGYFRDIEFDYVVLDEAQAIKNANTEAAKAARLLRGRHRLALSGTPIENRLAELWSLFEFLNPGMLGSAPLFRTLIDTNGDARRTGATAEAEPEAPDGRRLLARALRPFILRRTKEQVARDLPPKIEQTLYCDLDSQQRRLYDELREHYRQSLLQRVDELGMNRARMHVLEALLRLRQAACHPGLIDRARAEQDSAKLQVLWDLIQEVSAEGHKALIFSQFTSLLGILRTRLDREKMVYEYLDGKTRDRQSRVERFQTDEACKLFLVSLKAGGVGLNLTAADYVFLLDPWWNPAVEAQAIDRTHRIGQSRQVFAYRLIARDTVEEKVLQLQETKRDLADAIITADNSVIGRLTKDDLRLLLS